MDIKAFRSAERAAKQRFEVLSDLYGHMQKQDADGTTAILSQLAVTVMQFNPPIMPADLDDDRETSWELLRALDRHGEGLVPLDFGRYWEPGDTWISNHRVMRVVAKVDDQKRPLAFIGMVPAKGEVPMLSWRPDPTPRIWNLDAGETGSAYIKPAEAVASLADLWGRSESETRYFKRPDALFWLLVETRGVRIDLDGLESEAELTEVRNWLRDHGQFTLGSRQLRVGDLLDDPLFDGLGVILARTPAGLCDVLYVVRQGTGPCGEKKGEAAIMRGCDLPGSTRVWRPAARA